MSNIANQLVAVVATLSGFVAHDLLSQRSAPLTTASIPATSDTVTTRALALEGLSVEDWLTGSPRAERAALRAPGVAVTTATAAARPAPYAVDAIIARARVNDARFDGAHRSGRSASLR